MIQKSVISQKDMLVVKDEQGTFTAVLGNVRCYKNPRDERTYNQVILREITNESGSILVEKQWFDSKCLIRLARKNMDKKIKFTARCKVCVYKSNGNLFEVFLFSKIGDVSLTF